MSTVLRAPRGGVCSSSGRTASSRASSTTPPLPTAAPSRVVVALAPPHRVPARASLRCFASAPASERPGEVSCRAECGCFVMLEGGRGRERRSGDSVFPFFCRRRFIEKHAARSLARWSAALLSLLPSLRSLFRAPGFGRVVHRKSEREARKRSGARRRDVEGKKHNHGTTTLCHLLSLLPDGLVSSRVNLLPLSSRFSAPCGARSASFRPREGCDTSHPCLRAGSWGSNRAGGGARELSMTASGDFSRGKKAAVGGESFFSSLLLPDPFVISASFPGPSLSLFAHAALSSPVSTTNQPTKRTKTPPTPRSAPESAAATAPSPPR